MNLSTYLLFEGNCKQAMELYKSIFGGELGISLVGETPMKDMFPEFMHSRVLNARLQSAVVDISASDWLRPSEQYVQGNNMSLYISGGSFEETGRIFSALSNNAVITDALVEQSFGLYGALKDEFGVCWKFHATKN
ncbi:VOC family protein [Cellvibrio zantedeschiae]|uniref:VOC family protein n=1 Tax=Cellvibrio zantedeschiae TaxID=1237077 RepID=UPI001676CA1C|nr:VOC family protein [Cellvibrio zantedeschiae]